MSDENKSIRERNEELLQGIFDAQDGVLKSASAAGTNMIRRRIREDGFLRNIIPPEVRTNADLDRHPDHDRPIIYEDMEPLSPGAVSLSFDGSTDSQTFFGKKFAVVFERIATKEYVKNVNELRTYRMDLRQVITDNALKDMQTREDANFISLVDTVVGASNGVGQTGSQQNFEIQGGISRDSYTEVLNIIQDCNLNNGVFLMNRHTASNFIKWDRSEFGGDIAEKTAIDGLSALSEAKIMGVRHLFTIKRDIVPDNVVYLFTEPSFLGKLYTLDEPGPTMYVEKKKDFIRFQAIENLGCTIANVAGVAKVTFVP